MVCLKIDISDVGTPQLGWDFDVEIIPIKLYHYACTSRGESYYIHKAAWQWASLKIQKDHIKFVWDLDVDNIPVKLQHDTGNFRGGIMFTR